MQQVVKIWILGSVAAAFGIASTVLNIVVASNVSLQRGLTAIHILLFVAFGISLVAFANLGYICCIYVRNLHSSSPTLSSSAWRVYSIAALVAVVSLATSCVTLVWMEVRQDDLPKTILKHSTTILLAIWFALWAVTLVLETTVFVLLGIWTRTVLRKQSVRRLDLDFGIRVAPMSEIRPTTRDSNVSSHSRETMVASPPRTPKTRRSSNTGQSSSTKVGPDSMGSKYQQRSSARSSFDLPIFPAGEAHSIESAFDQYDTSSLHRAALHTSPTVAKSGLETIPGSRSESPANALNEPFMSSSPPHALSSDTATTLDWNPSSSPRGPPASSPSSSPPNFSRPTSRDTHKAPPPEFGISMHSLIHPLFRPNSPRPPPIAVAGTMVTASPLAESVITPRTLARLRSNSAPQRGHWKAMPSISSDRPSTTGSQPGSPGLSSSGPGSPGPSILEEEDLPPILPGFVLSAGQRSSFLGYGKRKSVKEKRSSRTLG